MLLKFHANFSNVFSDSFRYRIGYVALIAKVDSGHDIRLDTHDAPAPTLVQPAHVTICGAERHSALNFRFRLDQVGKGFSLYKIHFAVEKRTLRKLTTFSRAHAFEVTKSVHQRSDDRAPSMDMELGTVFTGKTPRCLKESHQTGVNNGPVRAVHIA
ncbi:hypothetical protein RHIZO_04349 [Rhizobiaceae bacterium]|nr:hypothetical protein RHIZO_04349 [Rhizobiaceae bacterium]